MTVGTISTRPAMQTELDRLKALLVDPRDSTAAVMLAQHALPLYDPARHKLSHKPTDERMPSEMSYPEFFRQVAMERFKATRNIAGAAHILDILIAEQAEAEVTG